MSPVVLVTVGFCVYAGARTIVHRIRHELKGGGDVQDTCAEARQATP
jgi:hypothetical protein